MKPIWAEIIRKHTNLHSHHKLVWLCLCLRKDPDSQILLEEQLVHLGGNDPGVWHGWCRALQHAKLDVIPSNTLEFRAWKNSIILLFGCLDISFLRKGGSIPTLFIDSSRFRLGFRCLSPFFVFLVPIPVSLFLFSFLLRKRVLFHYNLLILPDFPTLVSVLLSSLVRCCLLSSFFSLRKWVLCYYNLMVPFDLLVPLDSG